MRHRGLYEIGLVLSATLLAVGCDDRKPDDSRSAAADPAERIERERSRAPELDEPELDALAQMMALAESDEADPGQNPVESAQPETSASTTESAPAPALDPVRPVLGSATAPDPVQPVVEPTAAPDPSKPVMAAAPVNAVREVTVNDIVVDVPTKYEEVSGTACSIGHGHPRFRVDGLLLHANRGTIKSCEGGEWSLNDRDTKWTTDHDGNIYSTWEHTERATGVVEVFVRKMDATGKTIWEKAISMAKTQVTPTFLVASPAGVYVGGTSTGQLPGNPPEASRKPWIARLDASGALQWTRQERDEALLDGARDVALDGHDELYLYYIDYYHSQYILHKINTRGERAWAAEHDVRQCDGPMQLVPDGSAIFFAGGRSDGACLKKLDDKGQVLWTKTYTLRHSLVIDQVEGTTWRGKADSGTILALGSDSLALVGTYNNQYEHGSAPPPAFRSVWILTLDFDGQVQTTRHLRVGPLNVLPGQSGSSVSFSPSLAVLLPEGTLRLLGTRSSGKHGSDQEQLIVTLPGHMSRAPSTSASPAPASASEAAAEGTAPAKGSAVSSLWERWKD